MFTLYAFAYIFNIQYDLNNPSLRNPETSTIRHQSIFIYPLFVHFELTGERILAIV